MIALYHTSINASDSETSVWSSTPARAFIYDAYTSKSTPTSAIIYDAFTSMTHLLL